MVNKQNGHFSNIIKIPFTVLGFLSLQFILKMNLVAFILILKNKIIIKKLIN